MRTLSHANTYPTLPQITVDGGVSATTIQTLRSRGYLVICYISGGTLEPWRSDANLFPKGALGLKMSGWNEYWLDIRSTNPYYSTLKSLMNNRAKAVAAKGTRVSCRAIAACLRTCARACMLCPLPLLCGELALRHNSSFTVPAF